MAGPYDALIGPLTPGQQGWLPVDVNGTPTAAVAVVAQPALGTHLYVAVRANLTPLGLQDALVTNTGAPLHVGMNFYPELRYNPTGL